MSPFECSVGYLPPLFPSQEPDAAVPSALAFVRRCRSVWRKARKALVRAPDGPRQRLIATGFRRPVMSVVRRYGCLPRTCLSRLSLASWHPGSLVHTRSPRSLIGLRYGSSCLPLLVGFTLFSMYPGLSLFSGPPLIPTFHPLPPLPLV